MSNVLEHVVTARPTIVIDPPSVPIPPMVEAELHAEGAPFVIGLGSRYGAPRRVYAAGPDQLIVTCAHYLVLLSRCEPGLWMATALAPEEPLA